eukprot:g69107.t1
MKRLVMLVLFTSLTLPVLVASQPSGDLVTYLPGLGNTSKLSFRQWSGYLSWKNSSKKLHYWLVESQGDPNTDPLVLWLNGGPGCSSLDGLLQENGPILIDDNGDPYLNAFAWNRYASVVYLEAPAGVGFSYSSISSDYTTGDAQTAQDNWNALQTFFTLFPRYQKVDFFITGESYESYGGIYVPTLASEVQRNNKAKNGLYLPLKGFAVGNGLASDEDNDDSLIFFAYYHGLFSYSLWNTLKKNCCKGPQDQDCNFHDPTPFSTCWKNVQQAQQIIYDSGLNFYSLYANCTNTPDMYANPRYTKDLDRLFAKYGWQLGSRLAKAAPESRVSGGTDTAKIGIDAAKIGIDTAKSGIDTTRRALTGRLQGNVPCIDSYGITTYLRRQDVQEAIHVSTKLPWQWTICSDVLKYNRSSDENVIPFYNNLLQDYRALIYNGDTDMACNYLGDMWAVDSLGRALKTAYRPWHDTTGQVAGFVEVYDRLTYMTIKGAGHMVPQDRPQQALLMIKSFLDGPRYDHEIGRCSFVVSFQEITETEVPLLKFYADQLPYGTKARAGVKRVRG